jgi:transcription initiation factor TFIID subunit 10
MDAELDPEIDMAIDPAPLDPDNLNLEAGTVPEAREPTKKDISLRDFLSKMDDYAPIVRHYTSPLLLPPLRFTQSHIHHYKKEVANKL